MAGRRTTARPVWWSRDRVLEMVEAGERPNAIYRRAAAESGAPIGNLRQEAKRWQRNAAHKERWEAAMRSHGHSLTRGVSRRELSAEEIEAVAGKFIESGGNLSEAAAEMGVSVAWFYRLISKSHPEHDHDLTKAIDDARAMLGGHCVGVAWDAMDLIEDPFRRAMTALKIGSAFDPKIGGRHDRLDVVVSGAVRHSMSPAESELMKRKIVEISDRSRQLFGHSEPAEEAIIEGELV